MAIRSISPPNLRSLWIEGVALPLESLPLKYKQQLFRAFEGVTAGYQGNFSLVKGKGKGAALWNSEVAKVADYARRVGWLPPQPLEFTPVQEAFTKEESIQTEFLPGLGLVSSSLATQSMPMTVTWAIWSLVGLVRYCVQGVLTWRERRRAQAQNDSKSASHASMSLTIGGLYAAASVESFVNVMRSVFQIGGAIALKLAAVANGFFGGGLVISLFSTVRSLIRYFRFRVELAQYLGNPNLTDQQQVYGALRFLLDSLTGENASAKLHALKRRTSWSFVQELVAKGPELLLDPERFKEATLLVARALHENKQKNRIQMATALFSVIAGAGYLMGTAASGGMLSMAMGAVGVASMMLLNIALSIRDFARAIVNRRIR